MYAVLAVFIRRPDKSGERQVLYRQEDQRYEVKMAMLAVLVLAASILGTSALSANLDVAPGATSTTRRQKQTADENKLLASSPSAFWNHVSGSSPSNHRATYNNVNNSGRTA